MVNERDRWLIDGDCSKCRRDPYCSKQCKKSKEAVRAAVRKIIMEKTGLGDIKKAVKEIVGMPDEEELND